MTNSSDPDTRRSTAQRTIMLFGVLGAVSGSFAILIAHLGPAAHYEPFSWLELNVASILPGFAFGLVIGFALYRRGLASRGSYFAYVAASTLSYLAAYTMAKTVFLDLLGSVALTGMASGLFGSACLTAASALLFDFVRRPLPCLLMLLAGCLLGALLEFAVDGRTTGHWMVFFGAWQAGYAASLATALRPALRP